MLALKATVDGGGGGVVLRLTMTLGFRSFLPNGVRWWVSAVIPVNEKVVSGAISW